MTKSYTAMTVTNIKCAVVPPVTRELDVARGGGYFLVFLDVGLMSWVITSMLG